MCVCVIHEQTNREHLVRCRKAKSKNNPQVKERDYEEEKEERKKEEAKEERGLHQEREGGAALCAQSPTRV